MSMAQYQRFRLGENLCRATRVTPYRRVRGDPVYRPLQIYTLDPAESRLAGARAVVQVNYEPLEPGPTGALLEVVDDDQFARCKYRRVDLEDPRVLICGGLVPSPTDHLFHQQMVYAVAMNTYAAFSRALGRDLHWGFDRAGDADGRLRIYPHWDQMKNAFYSTDDGSIRFGYYEAERKGIEGRNLPGGIVFTCLSHDVVAHEVTHALLDGLRPYFVVPTNGDVLALHEALGDLVAIFQHFSYPDVVVAAMERSRGSVSEACLLTDVARQFGHTIGKGGPLRTAIDVARSTGTGNYESSLVGTHAVQVYDPAKLPHELGSVLVSALFDAFDDVYRRKTRRLVRLATGGTGVLPEGDLPVILLESLAKEVSILAAQFLAVCIRAIDYCPPVDVTFGDYLRALITADYDLVPSDPWGYREAFVDAFRRRGIYPSDVATLSEESLLWKAPPRPIRRSARLSFAQLRFHGDPSHAMDREELAAQADEVGRLVSDPAYADMFGIADPQAAPAKGQRLEPPTIESVRTLRRVGPDGQVIFDLIAEVVQSRWVKMPGGTEHRFLGGATIIFGPDGDVRYSVTKNILSQQRLENQQKLFRDNALREFWVCQSGKWEPARQPFRILHKSEG